MARKYRKFSPEFKDEAVKLVIDGSRPLRSLASSAFMREHSGNWVNQYRRDHDGNSVRTRNARKRPE